MNRTIFKVSALGSIFAAAIWLLAYSPNRGWATPTIPIGDVMVSISNGLVDEFTPAGVFVQTLDTTKGAGIATTGSAFDSTGNFYVTDFNGNDVSEFDPTGTLIGSFGSGYSSDDESILFDSAGNVYVGQADGTHQILKFSSTGGALASFSPATEIRGTDWIDLGSDECTMFYTSEGSHVKSFNVCTSTQNADFNVAALPGAAAYALRILPAGSTGLSVGDVLVADTSEVTVLDAAGNQIRHDTAVGSGGGIFALNLDPDGTTYWTADFNTDHTAEGNERGPTLSFRYRIFN